AIVGAGDSAAEEALYLSNLCHTVHMFVRRDEMRASKIMQDRVRKQENIKIYWNTETEEILGDDHVTGVRVFNNQTGEKQEIAVAGFFVAIGHVPNTGIFKEWIDMEDTGYLKHESNSTKTNVPGVFVSGDAADHVYRQAITAAGTGCMAALDAERYLGAQGII
ncbi:MAG: FAD-dependent oxidoreductase, partial [Bacteroidota bacterium]